ncbi:unnamed protein product [Acanthoscelides obtectus]|uniref:Uncharacterized protein n=1 Tax=Acanthoscelides obtectus TaxID=200917 RepID=A0A9P0Q4T6_ACAOB|nr:unnamed protein product [Acanthoscelides obtectus]CAK1622448.1 hypothetical protein AOBTE_LOCUS1492 [Acanthoscelides obtectus]
MQNLKQLRSNDSPNRKNQGKKKKLDVPAGRSIRSEDISDREQASSSGVNRSDPKKNSKSRKRLISEVSSSECSDTDINLILARDQSDDEEDNLRLAQLTNRNPRSNYDGNLEALGPSTQLPEPIPPDCNTRFIEDPILRHCSKSDGQSCSNEIKLIQMMYKKRKRNIKMAMVTVSMIMYWLSGIHVFIQAKLYRYLQKER